MFREIARQQGSFDEVVINDDRVEELVTLLTTLEEEKERQSEASKAVRKFEKRLRELLPEREVSGLLVRIGESPFVIDGLEVERSVPVKHERQMRFQYRPGRLTSSE